MPDAQRLYPSDLSDAEWAALEPLPPPPSPVGRPLKWPRRLMVEAIFYLVRSGCAWPNRRAASRSQRPEISGSGIGAAKYISAQPFACVRALRTGVSGMPPGRITRLEGGGNDIQKHDDWRR